MYKKKVESVSFASNGNITWIVNGKTFTYKPV